MTIKRWQIINYLIENKGYTFYLEIGIRRPKDNFDKIICLNKEGVDPVPQGECKYIMTSDEFFTKLSKNKKYDLIFIDGLHLAKQVLKDIIHSLKHLSLKGTIVVHDCNPSMESRQNEFYKKGKRWNGTVWKAFARLRMTRKDLEMYVVDADQGMGMIKKGEQKCFSFYPFSELTWKFLVTYREELLNLCSVSDFLKRKIL